MTNFYQMTHVVIFPAALVQCFPDFRETISFIAKKWQASLLPTNNTFFQVFADSHLAVLTVRYHHVRYNYNKIIMLVL